MRRKILSEKVANMAPSWVPRWSQNGEKIDAKIDQKIDAFWNRFLKGFWWIVGWKWTQIGTKKRSKIEAAAKAEKPTKHKRANV